jgi:hypothetical protein
MPDSVNQLWLRYPDGSICTPRDPSLCLHAHLLNNGVTVIQHTDLHTWSLTASGLLQLDSKTECVDVNQGTKASIINCEYTNSSFVFGNTLNFASLVDLASIISIYDYSTVKPNSKLVYLYGKFELSRMTQNQVVLVRRLSFHDHDLCHRTSPSRMSVPPPHLPCRHQPSKIYVAHVHIKRGCV